MYKLSRQLKDCGVLAYRHWSISPELSGTMTGIFKDSGLRGWKKWADNVFYNRPGTAYSYEVTTSCGSCKVLRWK